MLAACTLAAMVVIESSEDTGSAELPESPKSVVRSACANASLNAL